MPGAAITQGDVFFRRMTYFRASTHSVVAIFAEGADRDRFLILGLLAVGQVGFAGRSRLPGDADQELPGFGILGHFQGDQGLLYESCCCCPA